MRIPAIPVSRWKLNSNNDAFRSDGYVGIGTDSPGGLLGLKDGSTYITVDSSGDLLLVVSASNAIDTSGNVQVPAVQFKLNVTPTYSEGLLYWNDAQKTLSVATEVTDFWADINHTQTVRVRNSSGQTIPKGTVVFISGAQGSRPTIDVASNTTEAHSTGVAGIVAHSIADNAIGYVVINGLIEGIKTDGYAEGDVVYLDGAGGLTSTEPVSPLHSVRLGIVVRSHVELGTILVAVNDGSETTSLHDVSNVPPAQQYDALLWDTISETYIPQQVGEILSQGIISGPLIVDGYILPSEDDAYGLGLPDQRWSDLFLGPNSLHIVSTDAETGFARNWHMGLSASGDLTFDQGIDEKVTITTSGRVGIGTPNPSVALDTVGSIRLTGELQQTGSVVRISSSGIFLPSFGSETTPSHSFNGDSDTGMYRIGPDILGLTTGAAERMRIDDSGNVGINTVSPSGKLHIQGADVGQQTLVVRRVVGQTANILAIQNDSGINLAHIDNSGRVRATAGNASLPAFAFDGEADSGMYLVSANILGFSTGGQQQWRLDSGGLFSNLSGKIFTHAGDATQPGYTYSSDSDSGMYSRNPDELGWALGGIEKMYLDAYGLNVIDDIMAGGDIIPTVDNIYDLGENTTPLRWRSLYLGPSSLHVSSTAAETTTARDYTIGVVETVGSSQGNLSIGEAGASNVFHITSDGLVGIGGLPPNQSLTNVALQITNNKNVIIEGSQAVLYLGNTARWLRWFSGQQLELKGDTDPIVFRTTTGANSLYIDINDNVGLSTDAPTHSLTFASTKSDGIAIYNTADQITNYERGLVTWSSNVLTLRTQAAGTGTARSVDVLSGGSGLRVTNNSTMQFFGAGTDYIITHGQTGKGLTLRSTQTTGSPGITLTNNVDFSASSGTQSIVQIDGTINQSSTAGYNVLGIDITETAVGSGLNSIIYATIDGGDRFRVTSNNGSILMGAAATGWGQLTGGSIRLNQNASGNGWANFTQATNIIDLSSTAHIRWASSSTAGDTPDIGLTKDSPGTLRVSDASTGVGNLIANDGYYYGDITALGTISSTGLSTDGHIIPETDNVYDLGENTTPLRWRAGYFGPGSLHIASTAAETGTARDWVISIDQVTNPGTLQFGQIATPNNFSIETNGALSFNPSGSDERFRVGNLLTQAAAFRAYRLGSEISGSAWLISTENDNTQIKPRTGVASLRIGTSNAAFTPTVVFGANDAAGTDPRSLWGNESFSTHATHAITLMSTTNGVALYGTADHTTNYERGLISHNGSSLVLETDQGGTGTSSNVIIQNTHTQWALTTFDGHVQVSPLVGDRIRYTINNNGTGGRYWTMNSRITTRTDDNPGWRFENVPGAGLGFAASSGTQNFFQIQTETNQTGSAAFTALDIDLDVNNSSTGAQSFIAARRNGSTEFGVRTTGETGLGRAPVTGEMLAIQDTGAATRSIQFYNSGGAATWYATAGGNFRLFDGSASTPVYSFLGQTNVGMYRVTTDHLGFSVGGTHRWGINVGNLLPGADNVYDIGENSTPLRVRSLYLGPASLHLVSTAAETNGTARDYTFEIDTVDGPTDGFFHIRESGNARVTMTPDGTVGINEVTPDATAKLHVTGNVLGNAPVRIENSAAGGASGIEYLNSAGIVSGFVGTFDTGGNAHLRINAVNSHHIRMLTGSTEALRIDTSQNIGIGPVGVTGPTSRVDIAEAKVGAVNLQVRNTQLSGSASANLELHADANSQIRFANSAGATRGAVRYVGGTDRLQLDTVGTTRLTVNAAVAVESTIPYRAPDGTAASPAYSFTGGTDVGLRHAAGTLRIVTAGADRWNITGGGSLAALGSSRIVNNLGSESVPSYSFTGNSTVGMWSPGADTLAFSTNAVEAMRIDSSGNVGINTTSPGARLHVNGNVIVAEPTSNNHAATKAYVDGIAQGLEWQAPVILDDLTDPPSSPEAGDGYIIGGEQDVPVATGAWTGKEEQIARWNGSNWDFVVPADGYAVWVTEKDYLVVYNSSYPAGHWLKFGSTVTHANLQGLAEDDHLQYLRVDGYRGMTGDLVPDVDLGVSLGTSSLRWDDLFLGPASLHIVANPSELTESPILRDWNFGINVADGNLHLSQNSDAYVAFSTDGNVGINELDPQSLLHISEDFDIIGNHGLTLKNIGAGGSGRPIRILDASDTQLAHWSAGGLLRAGDGTISFPSLTFVNNLDTGLYSDGIGRLGLTAGGVKSLVLTSDNVAFTTIDAYGDVQVQGNNHLVLPQVNGASFPTLTFGDDDGFYASAAGTLNVATQGTNRWIFTASVFGSQATSGAGIWNETASSTNPTLTPWRSDSDTGVGTAGADILSLIAGGVEGFSATETGGSIELNAYGDLRLNSNDLIFDLASDTRIVNNTTGFILKPSSINAINVTAGNVRFGVKIRDAGTGSPLEIGSGSAFNHPLVSDDVHFSGAIEVDGYAWFDGGIGINSDLEVANNISADRFLAGNGSTTLPSFSFINDSDTGFYTSGTGSIRVTNNGQDSWTFSSSSSIFTASDSGARIQSGFGSTALPGYAFNNDADTGMYRAAVDTLGFVTGAIEKMRIWPDGTVSIDPLGTHTDKGVLLNVQRNTSGAIPGIAISGDDGTGDGGAALNFQRNDVNIWQIFFRNNTSAGNETNALAITTGTNSYSNPQLIIETSGNVGIGTPTPNLVGSNRALTISDTATSRLVSLELQGNQTTDVDFAEIDFYNDANRNAAIVVTRDGANNTAKMRFFTNNAGSFGERAVIDPNGNVGIGIADPTTRLHVRDSGSTSIRVDAGTQASLTLDSNASSAAQINFRQGGDNWVLRADAASGDMVLSQASLGTVLRVDQTTGNIGIGNITPDFKLQVDGYVVPEIDNIYNLGTSDLRWRDAYLGPESLKILSRPSDPGSPPERSYKFSVNTDGNLKIDETVVGDIIEVDSGGRVGFGTTPNAAFVANTLDVAGTVNVPQEYRIATSSVIRTVGNQTTYGPAGASAFGVFRAGGLEAMKIDTNTFVGIGTIGTGASTPAAQLHIQNDVSAGDVQMRVENIDNTSALSSVTLNLQTGGTAGGDPRILWTIPGGAQWVMSVDNNVSDEFRFTGAGNNIWRASQTGSAFEVEASQLLVPDGTAGAPSISFASETNTGWRLSGSGSIGFVGFGVQRFTFNSDNTLRATGGSAPRIVGANASDTVPTFIPNQASTNTGIGGLTGQLSLITGGTEALRISASQQVGIGVDSPNEILTINGVLSLQETDEPTATDGYGKIYVKNDDELYFKKADGYEVGLSRGAAILDISTVQTTNYNASFGEVVRSDPSGGGFTVTLPLSSSIEAGRTIIVKNVTTSTNTITIQGSGGQTIDGFASVTIQEGFMSLTLVSYGTEWGRV